MDFKKNYTTKIEELGIKKIKAGKFDYLSWSHCQKVMKELDPNSNYTIKFNDQDCSYIWGGFVRVELFFNGKTIEHAYPVLDAQNNGIIKVDGVWKFVTKPTKVNPKPTIKQEVTSFDVNNAQMRGFAKLFSMETGIGLSIFTGEDVEQYQTLDDYEEEKVVKNELAEAKKEFADYFNRYNTIINEKINIAKEYDSSKMNAQEWRELLSKCKKIVEDDRTKEQEKQFDPGTQKKVADLFGWENE